MTINAQSRKTTNVDTRIHADTRTTRTHTHTRTSVRMSASTSVHVQTHTHKRNVSRNVSIQHVSAGKLYHFVGNTKLRNNETRTIQHDRSSITITYKSALGGTFLVSAVWDVNHSVVGESCNGDVYTAVESAVIRLDLAKNRYDLSRANHGLEPYGDSGYNQPSIVVKNTYRAEHESRTSEYDSYTGELKIYDEYRPTNGHVIKVWDTPKDRRIQCAESTETYSTDYEHFRNVRLARNWPITDICAAWKQQVLKSTR